MVLLNEICSENIFYFLELVLYENSFDFKLKGIKYKMWSYEKCLIYSRDIFFNFSY